jgi:hypothetical protein
MSDLSTTSEKERARVKLHNGDTIRTFKGHYIDIFNPDHATIDIDDIAHALSQVCRFAGHTYKFYSVAQHSVECVVVMQKMGTVDKRILLTMLLHDATEAYIGDMARPIKRRLPQYKAAENVLMSAIAEKFGLVYPFPDIIKTVDNHMLEIEHDCVIMRQNYFPCKDPHIAKDDFLYLYNALK